MLLPQIAICVKWCIFKAEPCRDYVAGKSLRPSWYVGLCHYKKIGDQNVLRFFVILHLQILFECVFAKSVAAEQQSVGIVWSWTSHIPVDIHLCKVLTKHEAVAMQTDEQAVSRVDDVARFGVVACPECLEADSA